MEDNLKHKTLTSIAWMGTSRTAQEVLGFIVKIVLARLLLPDDFGLAAMAFIVISSIDIFGGFGIGQAYIQFKDKSEALKHTYFYMITGMNIFFFAVTIVLAPYIGKFFKNPVLTPMVYVLAFSFLIKIIGSVSVTDMVKQMKFKQRTIMLIVGTVAYAITTIVLAWKGFGAWSIVWGSIAMILSQNLMQYYFVPYIPRLKFDRDIANRMFSFGKQLTVGRITNVVIQNGDDTMIGKFIGSAALGFYSLAQHLATFAVAQTVSLISQVAYPLFCKLQDQKERLKTAYLKSFKLGNMLAIPGIMGIVVLAPQVVTVLVGAKWLPIVPFIYILSIAALINTVNGLNINLMKAIGKPEIIKNISIANLVIFGIFVYPLIKLYGVSGICILIILFAINGTAQYIRYVRKYVKGLIKQVIPVLLKIGASTLVMSVIVFNIKKLFAVNVLNLITLILIGIIVYFGVLSIIDKQLISEVKEAYHEFFPKKTA